RREQLELHCPPGTRRHPFLFPRNTGDGEAPALDGFCQIRDRTEGVSTPNAVVKIGGPSRTRGEQELLCRKKGQRFQPTKGQGKRRFDQFAVKAPGRRSTPLEWQFDVEDGGGINVREQRYTPVEEGI